MIYIVISQNYNNLDSIFYCLVFYTLYDGNLSVLHHINCKFICLLIQQTQECDVVNGNKKLNV